MPHPCPHHCPPERGSGLGIIIAIAVLAAVVAAIRTAMPAIEHGAELVLEVLVITVASIAGLAAIGAASYVALRIRRSHGAARQALVSHTPAIQRGSQALSSPQRQAIEAPKRGLYVIHDEQHDHDRL
jgi:hypothetical protein